MRTKGCVLSLVALFTSAAQGQSYRHIRYLGEIGHLGTTSDPRNFVDLGIAAGYPANGDVRFEGKDDKGRLWRATIATLGGIGWTDVWRADFDGNSRPDLMVAATFPTNGRCISPVTITFLMFDSQGRPVPWTIETYLLNSAGPGKMPAILEDFNHNHRAEFIATGCAYSNPPRFGEDRGIEGIYEAEDAHWALIRPVDLQRYSNAVRANHVRDGVYFLPEEPEKWRDYGNSDGTPKRQVSIRDILKPDPQCQGHVRLHVVDGRVVPPPQPDPCETLGQNRFEVSGGDTCFGWPTVVDDGANGREIVVAGSLIIEQKLREIAASRATVTLVGRSDPARCSPTLLWVIQPR